MDIKEHTRTMLRGLKCWKVGLAYGSVIYFEFGDRLVDMGLVSHPEIGVGTIWLESDVWVIQDGAGKDVVTSDSISRDLVETILNPMFHNAELTGIEEPGFKVTLEFDNGLSVIAYANEKWLDEGDDTITVALPSGRYVGHSRPKGFSISEVESIVRSDWYRLNKALGGIEPKPGNADSP